MDCLVIDRLVVDLDSVLEIDLDVIWIFLNLRLANCHRASFSSIMRSDSMPSAHVERLGVRDTQVVVHQACSSVVQRVVVVAVRLEVRIEPWTCLMKLFRLFSAFMFSMLNEFVFTSVSADAGIVRDTDAIVTFANCTRCCATFLWRVSSA